MAPSIRLVFRRERQGTTIEPFLGSAAFEALLGIPKKRREALILLRILVACAFLVSDRVGILLVSEGDPLPKERKDLSLEALREQHFSKGSWYRMVAVPVWFHFSQVEAKLLQPLELASGQVATHYFREFWVRAVEHQVAHDAVATLVTRDSARILSFGDVVSESPPSQLGPQGNVIAGGRVYFTDRS
jgi:hypothetical protein